MIGSIKDFILLKTGDGGAMGRLQSFPLLRGLQSLPGVTARHVVPTPGVPLTIDRPTCILFIYCAETAIPHLRDLRRGPHQVLIVALGADIYKFDEYARLHDFVDFYVMPTDIHRQVLAYQVYRPVYTLAECLDPIGLPSIAEPGTDPGGFPIRRGRRAYWFGHSESFEKGMASLMPVITANVASQVIGDFRVILNEAGFANRFGIPTIPYSGATFRTQAGQFDYAILSHLPLDLHVNSWIKSPNKAVTALMAGTIPLASDTLNYRALLGRFGLEKFLFCSAMDLDRKLRSLDPVTDSEAIQRSGIVPALRAELSEPQLLENFKGILAQHAERDLDAAGRMPDQCPTSSESRPSVREQFRALKTSVLDAVARRAHRLVRR